MGMEEFWGFFPGVLGWEFGADTHGNGSHDGVVHSGGNRGVAFRDFIGKKAGKRGKILDLGGFSPKRAGKNDGKWGKIPDLGSTLKGLGKIWENEEKSQILVGLTLKGPGKTMGK